MIEWRGSLRRDIDFESGNKLKAGTIIYAEETEAGWIASHYSEQGSSTCFAIDPDDFSIWRRSDTKIEYVVAQESDPAEDKRAHELQIKRVQRQIEDYRREANRLEALVSNQDRDPASGPSYDFAGSEEVVGDMAGSGSAEHESGEPERTSSEASNQERSRDAN